MDLTKILTGKKTYLAAFGLLGLALFQYAQGDLSGAVHAGLEALGAFGLRSALANAFPAPPQTPSN